MLPLPVTVVALRVTLPVVVLVVVMLPLRVMLPPVSEMLPDELMALLRVILAVSVDFPIVTAPTVLPKVGPRLVADPRLTADEKLVPNGSSVMGPVERKLTLTWLAALLPKVIASERRVIGELLLTTSTALAPRNVRLVVAPPEINNPVCTPVKPAAF